jgi:hypothetical protein
MGPGRSTWIAAEEASSGCRIREGDARGPIPLATTGRGASPVGRSCVGVSSAERRRPPGRASRPWPLSRPDRRASGLEDGCVHTCIRTPAGTASGRNPGSQDARGARAIRRPRARFSVLEPRKVGLGRCRTAIRPLLTSPASPSSQRPLRRADREGGSPLSAVGRSRRRRSGRAGDVCFPGLPYAADRGRTEARAGRQCGGDDGDSVLVRPPPLFRARLTQMARGAERSRRAAEAEVTSDHSGNLDRLAREAGPGRRSAAHSGLRRVPRQYLRPRACRRATLRLRALPPCDRRSAPRAKNRPASPRPARRQPTAARKARSHPRARPADRGPPHPGEFRRGRRRPAIEASPVSVFGHDTDPCLPRRDGTSARSDSHRSIRDHFQGTGSLVAATAWAVGLETCSGSTWAGKSSRNTLAGAFRAGGRHPRHSGSGVARLLAIAWMHPDGHSRCGVALRKSSCRHACDHHARLTLVLDGERVFV